MNLKKKEEGSGVRFEYDVFPRYWRIKMICTYLVVTLYQYTLQDIHGWRTWEYSVYNFKIYAFECQFARCKGSIVCLNETCLLTFYSYDHFRLFYIQR